MRIEEAIEKVVKYLIDHDPNKGVTNTIRDCAHQLRKTATEIAGLEWRRRAWAYAIKKLKEQNVLTLDKLNNQANGHIQACFDKAENGTEGEL